METGNLARLSNCRRGQSFTRQVEQLVPAFLAVSPRLRGEGFAAVHMLDNAEQIERSLRACR